VKQSLCFYGRYLKSVFIIEKSLKVGIVEKNNINIFIGNCLLMASSVNTELENLKAVFLI
jgi:hypothetical protein